MSYTRDLNRYKDYRDNSSLTLDVDMATLLYKLSALLGEEVSGKVTSISQSTTLSQKDLATIADKVGKIAYEEATANNQLVSIAKLTEIYESLDAIYNRSTLDSIEEDIEVLRGLADLIKSLLDRLLAMLEKGFLVNLVGAPFIINDFVSSSSQQKEVTLPAGVRRFSIKARGDVNDVNGGIRYAFQPGVVTSNSNQAPYYTITEGFEENEHQLNLDSPLTIYLGCMSTVGVNVCIKYWTKSHLTSILPPQTPHIIFQQLELANTEYVVELPSNVRKYSIKTATVRPENAPPIRYAYASGIVADGTIINCNGYYTIQQNSEDFEDHVALSSLESFNLYLACSEPNVTVSIKYWV